MSEKRDWDSGEGAKAKAKSKRGNGGEKKDAYRASD